MWSILVMHQVINGVKVIGSGSGSILNQISLSGSLEDVSMSPLYSEIRGILKKFMTSYSCPLVIYGDFFSLGITLQIIHF